MKRIALILSAMLLTSISWAQNTAMPVTTTQNHTETAQATLSSGVPLNSYGAVDVHAHVPLSAQVPTQPSSLKLPDLNPLVKQYANIIPAGPQLNAKSYLLMSSQSGQIIAEHNANKRYAPASITKLMLLYLAEKALASGQITLQEKVTVPTVAWATGGSSMFLKPHQSVSIQDLILGTIVESGNDAAVTLATHIAGSQQTCVDMMNQQAKALGMTNTHFSDVMGLPAPNHYSSAHDLALLARAIIRDYPQYYSWYKTKWFTFNGIRQPNFNQLLFIYPYAEGLKTGSTQEAGYSLVSAAKMPDRPQRLIAVVLGAGSKNASAYASKTLLTYGFRFFKTQELYAKGQVIRHVPITSGQKRTLAIGLAHNAYVTYPANSQYPLKANLVLNPRLSAPIHSQEPVGTFEVSYAKQNLIKDPVIALENIQKGSLWQRISGYFSGIFHHA